MQSQFPKNYVLDARRTTKGVQSLMGIISGLICDGELNDNEILYLRTWMTENQDLESVFPATIIYRRIKDVLADNIITAEERDHLLKEFQDLSGNKFEQTGASQAEAIHAIFNPSASVHFEGRVFVFTGEFLWGTRRECVKAVEKRGGIAKDSVTKETNFLVIGAMASPDWITANFGRKIQKAADMVHAKKHDIAIIREETWSAFL